MEEMKESAEAGASSSASRNGWPSKQKRLEAAAPGGFARATGGPSGRTAGRRRTSTRPAEGTPQGTQRQCRKSIQERAERCKRQQTETQHRYSTIDTRQVYTRQDTEANAYRERSHRPAMARCSPGRRVLLQIPVRVRQRRRALHVVAVPLQAPPGKGAS